MDFKLAHAEGSESFSILPSASYVGKSYSLDIIKLFNF